MKTLENIFSNVSFEWIDDNRTEILKSSVYEKFLELFPKLKIIFQKSISSNKVEFERTIRHTFRLLIIYFQVKMDKFKHKSMNSLTVSKLKKRVEAIDVINANFLTLVLILHDIGRPFNRKLHTYESAKLVEKWNLLEGFGLSEKDKTLIMKVIEYHLLIGTIFTGESTYYALTSLLNDVQLAKYLGDQEFVKNFLLLSSTFTILDPLGYFYAEIFDHYIEKYAEIEKKLAEMLRLWPDIDLIQNKLENECFNRLDWRLACALRIFQNIGTRPQLTYDFYVQKIKNSVEKYLNKKLDENDWNHFKKTALSKSYLIQLKYALVILMLLASGEFKRIFKPEIVNTNLIQFWVLLNQRIAIENEKTEFKNHNWNVIFDGLPHWSEFKGKFSKILDMNRNKLIIENAKVSIDKERKENWLILDFKLENEI